jgi:hypothetical protein
MDSWSYIWKFSSAGSSISWGKQIISDGGIAAGEVNRWLYLHFAKESDEKIGFEWRKTGNNHKENRNLNSKPQNWAMTSIVDKKDICWQKTAFRIWLLRPSSKNYAVMEFPMHIHYLFLLPLGLATSNRRLVHICHDKMYETARGKANLESSGKWFDNWPRCKWFLST